MLEPAEFLYARDAFGEEFDAEIETPSMIAWTIA